MTTRKRRRIIAAAALMVGLLIAYVVNPPAAWATLAGFVVAWLLAQPGFGEETPPKRDEGPEITAAPSIGDLSRRRPTLTLVASRR